MQERWWRRKTIFAKQFFLLVIQSSPTSRRKPLPAVRVTSSESTKPRSPRRRQGLRRGGRATARRSGLASASGSAPWCPGCCCPRCRHPSPSRPKPCLGLPFSGLRSGAVWRCFPGAPPSGCLRSISRSDQPVGQNVHTNSKRIANYAFG